jgi:hypothetical protein
VKDASVFAARSSGLTLAGGRAVNSFDGEEDRTVRGAKTDSEGRFELALSIAAGEERPAGDPPASTGAAPGLAISSSALDAWPVPLPAGDTEAVDRQFVEVVSGKTTPISFVRTTGTRLVGSVEWDEGTRLTGVILSVRKAASPEVPQSERRFPHLFDARLLRVSSNEAPREKSEITGNRGLFLTERIPPGTYEVHAEGYVPLTPEQERRTGLVRATLTAQSTVKVPESGVVPSLKLKLKKPASPAKRFGNSD